MAFPIIAAISAVGSVVSGLFGKKKSKKAAEAAPPSNDNNRLASIEAKQSLLASIFSALFSSKTHDPYDSGSSSGLLGKIFSALC
ncbi:MAG: hypothetical protein V1824_04620 [archaeon]